MNYRKKYDLEDRIIDFSVEVLNYSEKLPGNYVANYLMKQLIRSATSPAFNYSEAKSAESRKDFIHKFKIAVKELRETHTCLLIIRKKQLLKDNRQTEKLIKECDELISIFVKSIQTAQKNMIT